jgi:hypothetical protein
MKCAHDTLLRLLRCSAHAIPTRHVALSQCGAAHVGIAFCRRSRWVLQISRPIASRGHPSTAHGFTAWPRTGIRRLSGTTEAAPSLARCTLHEQPSSPRMGRHRRREPLPNARLHGPGSGSTHTGRARSRPVRVAPHGEPCRIHAALACHVHAPSGRRRRGSGGLHGSGDRSRDTGASREPAHAEVDGLRAHRAVPPQTEGDHGCGLAIHHNATTTTSAPSRIRFMWRLTRAGP